jgi:hypothetical protein
MHYTTNDSYNSSIFLFNVLFGPLTGSTKTELPIYKKKTPRGFWEEKNIRSAILTILLPSRSRIASYLRQKPHAITTVAL